MAPGELILWFDQLGMKDVPRVGGKNASLGEMVRSLSPAGVRIPDTVLPTTVRILEVEKKLAAKAGP